MKLLTAALALLLLLPACTSYQKLEVDGKTRRYILHIPPAHQPGVSLPLLIALHPFTGTGPGMEAFTGFSELADREGFIVAYPNGIRRGWNAGRDAEGVDDVKFLLALIAEIESRYSVDPKRIYVTGASAGSMMAQFFACNSTRVAAIAGVMGSMPRAVAEACTPSHPVPTLFIHGREDPIVPYDGGETTSGTGSTTVFLSAEENAAFWAASNGCEPEPEALPLLDADGDATTVVLRHTYTCPETAPVVLYDITGGGHTWPGEPDPYPEFIVGPLSTELEASEVIWEFLKQQRNQAPAAP